MSVLVTGAAGFIGSNFVLRWLATTEEPVVTLDKLTYAGNLANLASIEKDPRHVFVRGDIGDIKLVEGLLRKHKPRAVVNFAAETHVDRSIRGPGDFITTNVMATYRLLEAVRAYWLNLDDDAEAAFRFLHISTDEVYGALEPDDLPFTEASPYAPNNPYAASKAAADHMVRAYHRTYGLPTLTTNCSNNYGPFQFPEKLIPLAIHNARSGRPIPLYGDGGQIRDWLHVDDHCAAICRVLEAGKVGSVYNIGGRSERTNLAVVKTVCRLLDELAPRPDANSHGELITFITDRRGHDRRYAIDTGRIETELGWTPEKDFDAGLRQTVEWYLGNPEWLADVTSGAYRTWIDRHYGGAV
ncbi:MAG: dTDP-glucose 4,6-dehydratase [Hyphomicrobiales bacterium]|nr:dTDP-glucose 4,6-dehydratase [Hyphomicrobiales bacterium]